MEVEAEAEAEVGLFHERDFFLLYEKSNNKRENKWLLVDSVAAFNL